MPAVRWSLARLAPGRRWAAGRSSGGRPEFSSHSPSRVEGRRWEKRKRRHREGVVGEGGVALALERRCDVVAWLSLRRGAKPAVVERTILAPVVKLKRS